MRQTLAQQVMARETRVALGVVAHTLGGIGPDERHWRLEGDEFLLHADGDHWFYYRRGQGITIERGRGADIAAESLWLAGTLYAAIACLNRLVPLHASAVASAGAAFAFTGASGMGKSTLIAALGRIGLPMMCDDTLVLDPCALPARADRRAGALLCLPGHKRLKLAPDALTATGAVAREPVGGGMDKRYADPPAGEIGVSLPLAALLVIEDGAALAITPIAGAARLVVLLREYYTVDLMAAIGRYRAETLFATMAALAPRIAMWRLTRPRDLAQLAATATVVADWIAAQDACGGTPI